MVDRPDSSTSRPGPLDGYRVIDLSSVVMGPFATQQLGDLGADVITIEDRSGDTNRSMGPGPVPGLSGVSMNLMRNKRSVGLDLKAPGGRDAFLRLAATADVVVTNLRPGPLGRLGLTYETVVEVRPDIVFCQAHGYRSDSDEADAPAYDDIIQSPAASEALFERQGHQPNLLPTLVADKVSGYAIATAVLAALVHRSHTGEGQRIEVPMIDVMRSFVLVEHGAAPSPNHRSTPPATGGSSPRSADPNRRPMAGSTCSLRGIALPRAVHRRRPAGTARRPPHRVSRVPHRQQRQPLPRGCWHPAAADDVGVAEVLCRGGHPGHRRGNARRPRRRPPRGRAPGGW